MSFQRLMKLYIYKYISISRIAYFSILFTAHAPPTPQPLTKFSFTDLSTPPNGY